ncbi:MAG: MATE family efflux transporter [Lachnospiraceae bacterium]
MKNYKTFFSYVIPSVLAFALSGIYAIVDGFFVGQSIGDMGLSAINFAYPVTALLQSLGTGIGMGGAIQYTIRHAQGKPAEEKQYFGGTLLLLLASSILATGCLFFLITPILKLLGAEGQTLLLGEKYLFVVVLSAVFQIFGTGLVPFIRNMGSSSYAMYSMVAGFFANIILDYLFVWRFEWGITGAAIATSAGQAITMLAAILFFIRKKAPVCLPDKKYAKQIYTSILRVSVSPMGLTFSPNFSLILMNRFLMVYGGEGAVACYACISYIIFIAYLLLQGVGDGSQPLVSKYYGENARKEMKHTCSLAYWTSGMLAAVSMVILFLLRNHVGRLFGASVAVSADVGQYLPLFLGSLLFLSYTRVTTSCFYATEKSGLSYILVYAEPVLLLILLSILPLFLGITGVWIAVPIVQIAVAVLAKTLHCIR